MYFFEVFENPAIVPNEFSGIVERIDNFENYTSAVQFFLLGIAIFTFILFILSMMFIRNTFMKILTSMLILLIGSGFMMFKLPATNLEMIYPDISIENEDIRPLFRDYYIVTPKSANIEIAEAVKEYEKHLTENSLINPNVSSYIDTAGLNESYLVKNGVAEKELSGLSLYTFENTLIDFKNDLAEYGDIDNKDILKYETNDLVMTEFLPEFYRDFEKELGRQKERLKKQRTSEKDLLQVDR